MKPTKENTLYLTIKQTFFDQIIAGTKKEEYREIKPTTYKKYLDVDEDGVPYFDDEKIDPNDPLAADICAYNNGVFPLYPKENLHFLRLAVGYAKERDEMTVEVESITFEPMKDEGGKVLRFHDDGEQWLADDNGELCLWIAVFHLGQIVEVHRKAE